MNISIWWIRRDLRLQDNPVFSAAHRASDQVLPLFILDPEILGSRFVGRRRSSFLFEGLINLDQELRNLGSALTLREGTPLQVLSTLKEELDYTEIFAQAEFTPLARRRDGVIKDALPLRLVGSPAIQPPDSVLKKDGNPYTVFTPYSRQWLIRDAPEIRGTVPERISSPSGVSSVPIPKPVLATSEIFPAGSAAGLRRLANFTEGLQAPIFAYGQRRDRLDLAGTSSLSPYLRFGMISPNVCLAAAVEAQARAKNTRSREGGHSWINELAWRDFYISILFHFPHVIHSDFRESLAAFPWRSDEDGFSRWKQGLTGFPVVDAAMRQLNQTGWIHNRARMITASFLTKDLLIHWTWGAQWFMEQLIDGDPASNSGGWQWAAGTGADSAPYFRIFNPVTQSQKFDPAGSFIRTWVPELGGVPDKFIHEPWKLPSESQSKYGFQLGKDYPNPIIDHGFARERALDLYSRFKR
ncbi:MAG: deoxyribodipyrimidine photo-lyase [Anaerolineales bacterium]|nr:deoxyribodipyrimidine photo-lyase [Anaerolineales bacterium]